MLGLGWKGREFIVMPITLLIIMVLSYITYKLYKNDKNDRELPLQAVTIIILVLEVAKQIRNIISGFDPWNLPLHYCSLFVFFFPFAQFGNEKSRRFFKPVSFCCALTVSVALYICPSAIMGHACENILYKFSYFHTFFFHQLVVLYTFLSIVLNDYIPKKENYKSVSTVLTVYSIIAIVMCYLLDFNYCNYLYNSLKPVDEIRLEIGQFLYSVAIFIIVVGGTALVSYLYYFIYNKIINKKRID